LGPLCPPNSAPGESKSSPRTGLRTPFTWEWNESRDWPVNNEKRIVVYRIGAARIPAGSDLRPVEWTVMVNPEITPLTQDKVLVWERCLSIPGLHGKVPRYPRVSIRYQTTEGVTVEQVAHSTWAALLQHECDHLDGILYPMRMEDLSTLAFNEAPGALAEEAAKNPEQIDPLFLDLVGRWPARERWHRSASL
jgi:peptide deformylase